MKRVVLVHDSADMSPIVPVGVLTLATIAQQLGIQAEVRCLPKRFEEETFVTSLADADVVGFSAVCSNYPRILLLTQRLKVVNPAMIIVLGGPQPTVTAFETVRRFPSIDLVIRGEAEIAWATFIEQGKQHSWDWSRLPGAVWKDGIKVKETPIALCAKDLDTIPFPLFEAYESIQKRKSAMIEVGRGCPYNCTFCVTNHFFSRDFRMKSPGRILAEMDYLNSRYGIKVFDFIHDMFTVRDDFVQDVCKDLKKRNYVWGVSSRSERLSLDMLEQMHEAGCRGFFFGIETGSQRLQKLTNKNLDVQAAVRTIQTVRQLGFRVTASIIMGFPQETRADLKDTLVLIMELMKYDGIDLQLPLFSPFTGSKIIEEGWRYTFDGIPSNSVTADGNPSAAEINLIASSFHLFSAFYHPSETEYSRQDYLALQVFLEDLHFYPMLKRYLLDNDLSSLIQYLVEGNFPVDIYELTRSHVIETMILNYATKHNRGNTILELLQFEKIRRKLEDGLPGQVEVCKVGARCVSVIIPSGILARHPGPFDSYQLALMNSESGIAAQIIWPERTPYWIYQSNTSQ